MITIAMFGMTRITQMILAAPAPAPAGGGGAGDMLRGPLPLMIAIMAVFLYVNWNSKRKQDKARQNLLNAMKRGDRVQTIGGVLGTIVEVRETEVVVKVDESNNTKIKFARSAISRVVSEEDKSEAK